MNAKALRILFTLPGFIFLVSQQSSATPTPRAKVLRRAEGLVTLDASGSVETLGLPLSYRWSIVSQPEGCAAHLSDATAIRPALPLDCTGDYVVQLTVQNAAGAVSAPARITVSSSPDLAIATPIARGRRQPRTAEAPAAGKPIILDGSPSFNPNGQPLQYEWSIVSAPSGSGATLNDVHSPLGSLVPDREGTYVAELVVRTTASTHDSTRLTISTTTPEPTAEAGRDQFATKDASISLDGSRSTDALGGPLAYRWSLLSVPPASQAALSNADLVNPTFTIDREGTYVAQLIVCNGARCSAPVTTVVSTGDLAPIAHAGSRQSVNPGSLVILDASRSIDPSAQGLSYQWSFNHKPSGSSAVLENPTGTTPSFTADEPGIYVAQVVATGANGLSSFSTVVVRTDCALPVAIPGETRQVVPHTSVTLTGSGSSGLCGENLTYHWSLLAAPPGSTATLSDVSAQSPTLTPDVRGDYAAQLIVSDGTNHSEPETVHLTMSSGPSIILPVNVSAEQELPEYYPVILSEPAPSGGLTVTLVVADSTVGTLIPSTVTFAAGSTALLQNPLIHTGGLGSTTITATASGFTSDTETFSVQQPSQFSPGSLQIQSGSTASTSVQFYGFDAAVTVISSDPAIATVVPSGLYQVYDVTAGSKTGSATITAIAPENQTATATVTVSQKQPVQIFCDSLTLGFNLQLSCTVGVYPPPSGNPTITATITSSDPSKILAAADGVHPGSPSASLTLPSHAGLYTQNFYVQGLTSSGSAVLTAAISGYQSSTITVHLIPSAVYFLLNSSPSYTLADGPQQFYVSAAPSVFSLVSSQRLRPGASPTLQITSSNPAVGVVSNATLSGLSTFTPLKPGTTTLTIVEPPGYTGSSFFPGGITSVTATVQGGGVVFGCNDFSIGPNVQTSCVLQLDPPVALPAGTMSTVTSSNPKLLVSTNPAISGTNTVKVGYQGAFSTYFYIQNTGATSGSANLTITTPGLNTTTTSFPFGPAPLGLSSDTGSTTFNVGSSATLNILVDNGGFGTVRGGFDLPVTITSSNPVVGTVSGSAVVPGEQSSISVSFKALAPGTTKITASAPNLLSSSITLTVIAPAQFSFSCSGLSVGYHLQAPCEASLSQPAPASGLQVTLAVNGPENPDNFQPLGLGASADVPAASSVIVLNFASFSTTVDQAFWVGNLFATSGQQSFTATATGYADKTVFLTMAPSGFSFGQSTTKVHLSEGPVSYQIYPTAIVGGKAGPLQSLMLGAKDQSLYVANLKSSVGQPQNPVLVQQGSGGGVVQFTPKAAGVDILCITQPPGFIEPKDLNELTITVTNP